MIQLAWGPVSDAINRVGGRALMRKSETIQRAAESRHKCELVADEGRPTLQGWISLLYYFINYILEPAEPPTAAYLALGSPAALSYSPA